MIILWRSTRFGKDALAGFINAVVSVPDGLASAALAGVNPVYLFFAGARTLGDVLPDVAGSTRPAVVLRLRGRTNIGATLVDVLAEYAEDLADAGGRLYLAGISDDVARTFRATAKLYIGGVVHLVAANPVLGASTEEALAQATAWLRTTPPHTDPDESNRR